MKFRVVILPAARRDLLRLSAFLVTHSPRSANHARTLISAAILSLGHMPERGAPGDEPRTRWIIVPFGQGGYEIRYRIDGAVVTVVRIFHTHEDR